MHGKSRLLTIEDRKKNAEKRQALGELRHYGNGHIEIHREQHLNNGVRGKEVNGDS